jgi:DNA-binding MurR/RpiR family transcriptional regulator
MLALVDGVRLTPVQRRIAQCLLDRPGTAAFLSSTELAALAGVSQPSVTRFAVALGFPGYPGLRQALRPRHGGAVDGGAPARGGPARGGPASNGPASNGPVSNGPASGSPARGGPIGGGPAGGARDNELQRALRGEMDNLGRLADRLADGGPDRAAVAAAGRQLWASRPLPVLGLRAAAALAGYFGYFAAKIHPDVRILDHGGSLLIERLEQAASAGASAVLAVLLPRYPSEALAALREARAAGLAVVLLTDSPIGPGAGLADVTLSAAVGARLVFDLQAAPMALAMAVLQAMCDAAPAATQARLEQFEASAARRGVFVR